jgi:hypothetical protein
LAFKGKQEDVDEHGRYRMGDYRMLGDLTSRQLKKR